MFICPIHCSFMRYSYLIEVYDFLLAQLSPMGCPSISYDGSILKLTITMHVSSFISTFLLFCPNLLFIHRCNYGKNIIIIQYLSPIAVCIFLCRSVMGA